jgi:hypothetical protein
MSFGGAKTTFLLGTLTEGARIEMKVLREGEIVKLFAPK